MAALPTNISTGRVVGQYGYDVVDGSDPDDEPDFVPTQGALAFSASVTKVLDATASPNPVTIIRQPIPAVLDDDGYVCTPNADGSAGARGVRLIATDDPDLNPVNWKWTVSFAFKNPAGNGIKVPEPFSFYLPSGATIDLTTVTPADGADEIGEAAATAAAAQAAASAAAALDAAEAAAAAVTDLDPTTASFVADPTSDTAAALDTKYVTAVVDGDDVSLYLNGVEL